MQHNNLFSQKRVDEAAEQLSATVKSNYDAAYQRGGDHQEKPRKQLSDAASKAAENAAVGAFKMLPIYGGMGLLLLAAPNKDPIAMVKPIAPFLAIGGFIVDAIKFPFYLVYATEEAARAGITKIASAIIERSPEHEFENRMLASFTLRLIQTAKLLCAIGLYDTEAMHQILEQGQIDDLIGYTLLHTAFASRYAAPNHLILANNKYLQRQDCLQHGLALFDRCHEAKQIIHDALGEPNVLNQERHMSDSRAVCQWIQYIHEGKQLDATQFPDTDPNTITALNRLIAMINPMVAEAKAIMPIKDAELGQRATNFKM